MKKGIRAVMLFVLFVLFAKMFALGEIVAQVKTGEPSLLSVNRAVAETAPRVVYKVPVKDCLEDSLTGERRLAASLQEKKLDLDTREAGMRAEEQRLLPLKNEISQKIDTLRALEGQLDSKIEADKTVETRKYKDLAKVYEAVPPAKAGAMLEKLDIATAAGITMNMKRDKAGIIWGYINPQRAVEITAAITRNQAK